MFINCKKHGKVKVMLNMNQDGFCPKCYKENMDEYIKNNVNFIHEDKKYPYSMGCSVSESTCKDCTKILIQGGFDAVSNNRSLSNMNELISKSFTIAEVAENLNTTCRKIRDRIRNSTLYGFKVNRVWMLPKFQFINSGEVPNIAWVIKALPKDLHPIEVLNWFNIPNPDLYINSVGNMISPLDWLNLGYYFDRVVWLAKQL